MDTRDKTLNARADLLAEEALHELGRTPFDEPDDYAEQCDYAGCYPWLTEFIHAHPHDIAAVSATLDVDAAAADPDYFC
jgi:hypothetical protein